MIEILFLVCVIPATIITLIIIFREQRRMRRLHDLFLDLRADLRRTERRRKLILDDSKEKRNDT